MNLLQLCMPFFQYVCRLNRLARAGANLPAAQIREEIKSHFERMRAQAAETPGLLQQFEMTEGRDGKRGIELLLMFFADFMVRESSLECAHEWEDLAAEYEEYAGDDKFFDLLDETLADKSPDAKDRLAVFYTCMGLGFTGGLADQPELFQRKLQECAVRLRSFMDESEMERICKEAYEHTDRRPLDVPPVERIVNRVLAFAAIFIIVLIGGGLTYRTLVQDLNAELETIQAELRDTPVVEGGRP